MPGANLDLPIKLDRAAAAGLSRQLQDALRDLIDRGGLPAGTLLPPSRRLAAQLGVSRNVVLDAYAQLRHEGLLTARTGQGTRVGARARRSAPTRERGGRRLDLHPDVTDLAGFPRLAWGKAVEAALREIPDQALGYGSPRGIHELRMQLAAYLARTRGLIADADSIVVCEGLMAAVGLLREALGLRSVAVPRISYPALAGALRRPGPPVTWLDVDGRGVQVGRLPRRPGCGVVVQPAHHYPLGVRMPEERALTLVEWARRRGGLIIENDANAELFHDGPGPVAQQGGAPDCTVLMGSVSRTLAPGLRIGWIVAPPELAARLARRRARTEPGPPVIEQMAFARFLADGALDRHVRRLRGTCRSRSEALTAALRRELPGCEVTAPPSGLHVTVALAPRAGEQRATAAAAAAGVRLFGMADHVLHGPPPPPALVVGFGALPEPSAPSAARSLRRWVDA